MSYLVSELLSLVPTFQGVFRNCSAGNQMPYDPTLVKIPPGELWPQSTSGDGWLLGGVTSTTFNPWDFFNGLKFEMVGLDSKIGAYECIDA